MDMFSVGIKLIKIRPDLFIEGIKITDDPLFTSVMYDPQTFKPVYGVYDMYFKPEIREKIRKTPEKMLQCFLNFMIEEFNFDGACQLRFLSEKP